MLKSACLSGKLKSFSCSRFVFYICLWSDVAFLIFIFPCTTVSRRYLCNTWTRFVATALASRWDKGVTFRSRRRRRCGQQDLHFASFVSFTNSGHTTLVCPYVCLSIRPSRLIPAVWIKSLSGRQPRLLLLLCCCFTSTVNNYGHVGTVT